MSSSSGVDLTESMVKKASCSFDFDSIYALNLSGLRLRSLHACLNGCADLYNLDLSSNLLRSDALSVLQGLKLPKLSHLNLTANRFADLSGLPPDLVALQTLKLEGNELGSGGTVSAAAWAGWMGELARKAPNLRHLSFRTLRGDRSNAVCTALPNYRSAALTAFPALQSFDGERLDGTGAAFYTAYASLESETRSFATPAGSSKAAETALAAADKDKTLAASKVDDWFAGSAQWPAVSGPEMDAEIHPRLAALKAQLRECNRVLTEECDGALKEYERKFAAAGAGASAGETRESPRGGSSNREGSFGFGAENDD